MKSEYRQAVESLRKRRSWPKSPSCMLMLQLGKNSFQKLCNSIRKRLRVMRQGFLRLRRRWLKNQNPRYDSSTVGQARGPLVAFCLLDMSITTIMSLVALKSLSIYRVEQRLSAVVSSSKQ